MVREHAATGLAREEEVYRRHAPQVFAYLLRHVPTHQDAEDLLVEVFIAVLEKLPALNIDEQRVAAYVQTVARNKAVDYYRKHGQQKLLPLETVMETSHAPEEMAPEQRMLERERMASLRLAFDALPPLQQTILRLRFVHGLRAREIAALLSKSENAIRVILSRSLKFLRSHHAFDEERN